MKKYFLITKFIKMFKCSQKDCSYETKKKGNFDRHSWCAHDIGEGKIFKCPQKDGKSSFVDSNSNSKNDFFTYLLSLYCQRES